MTALELDYVKIDEESTTMNKTALMNLHSKQLLNGKSNKDNSLLLLEVMGGIDNILSIYLASNNNISQDQLTQLHNILSSNASLESPQAHIPNMIQIFNINNTLSDRIFTEGFTNMIEKIVFNKWLNIMIIRKGIV